VCLTILDTVEIPRRKLAAMVVKESPVLRNLRNINQNKFITIMYICDMRCFMESATSSNIKYHDQITKIFFYSTY